MIQLEEVVKNDQPTLPLEEWSRAKKEHERAMDCILQPYLKKRSTHKKDPVLDFLFEYYNFRPAQLSRWSPGVGVKLEIIGDEPLPEISELTVDDSVAYLDVVNFPRKRLQSINWMLDLMQKTAESKPFFGCFGMHEWAMVYRADEVRHNQIPLRLSDDAIADFVESRPLLCTHFDAFRFFTEKARPMNKHQLERESLKDLEQQGCIHTNMDLYKWAFKMYPWISSETIREAFFLAVFARTIDMKASPYNLEEFGLSPIKIETEKGRKEYLVQQKEIVKRAAPVRKKLIAEYKRVLEIVGE